MEQRLQNGLIREVAVNETSIELAQAADAHGRAYLLEAVVDLTRDARHTVSSSLSAVIDQLVELFAVDTCNRLMADLILVNRAKHLFKHNDLPNVIRFRSHSMLA